MGPATGDHSIGINGTPANVGDPISINGIVIGTVGSNTLAGAKSFSFNANATNALVNEFMQSLTYEYNGILPPASVDFDWTYVDAGQLNDSGTTTVNFTPNQIPIVDLNGPLAGKDVALPYFENVGLMNIAPDAVIIDANEKDITLLNLNAAGFDTHSNSELVFGGTSVTAGTPSSGAVSIGALTLAYNYDGGDSLSFTNNAGAGEPISTSVLTVLARSIQYQNLSHDPTAGSIDFQFTVEDAAGLLSEAGTSTVTIVPVNDPPTGAAKTVSVAEDTEYTFLPADFGFSDVDGDDLRRVFIDQLPTNGQLLFKGNPFGNGSFLGIFDVNNGNFTYQPDANAHGSDSFMFSVSDDGGTANGGIDRDQTSRIFTLDVTPVNDAPTSSPVVLAPVTEDNVRTITQAELLVNAADIDSALLTADNLQVSSGTVADNGDGTWDFTPATNDDTNVTFTYTVTDGNKSVAGNATLDIVPVNDAPETTEVMMASIAEDSAPLLISEAELLSNATDIENDALSVTSVTIVSGDGTLVNNNNGTWTYTSAVNDDADVSFSYNITDSTDTVAGTATLDITPVNDVPQSTQIALTPIAEDSIVRLITQAELLANATDIDADALSATDLMIATGNGSLTDNSDGTWSYTPASNDNTTVSFNYCLLYTSPSPRDKRQSRMPSSA